MDKKQDKRGAKRIAPDWQDQTYEGLSQFSDRDSFVSYMGHVLSSPSGTEEWERLVSPQQDELIAGVPSLPRKSVRQTEAITYDELKEHFEVMTHRLTRQVEGAVDQRLRRTEALICDRLELTESEILCAVKDSPYAAMKLFSKIGLVAFALFLTLYVVSDISLLNPYFALFGLASCALYLAMAAFGEMRQKGKSEHHEQP